VKMGMTWFRMRLGAKRANSERRRRVRLWTCGLVDVRIHEMSESTRKELVSTSAVYPLVYAVQRGYIERFNDGNKT
jgi:hypothetical protein